ncbi:MAG: hypothetical protein IJ233_13760 [Pyramidobacter sp.]|nr:hypothetical protein [Pyramidobacter sp.]
MNVWLTIFEILPAVIALFAVWHWGLPAIAFILLFEAACILAISRLRKDEDVFPAFLRMLADSTIGIAFGAALLEKASPSSPPQLGIAALIICLVVHAALCALLFQFIDKNKGR